MIFRVAVLMLSIPVGGFKFAVNIVQWFIPGVQLDPVEEKPRFFRYGMGLRHPDMEFAYRRLRAKWWSSHEWTNWVSDWTRTDPQRAAKFFSLLILLTGLSGCLL